MPGAERDRPGDAAPSVGGFPLLRRIGDGGMSTVYLSYDVPGRRSVAVKVLADHLAGQPEFIKRFYREARLSQLLHHPNLVRGYAAGRDPDTGAHYLVLEFVDGPSAQAALARAGRLPVGAAVRIGLDVAAALRFLHARNYVHRDVKPDNVLLHPDGAAKLADLGLAKRLTDDSHLTSVDQGVGTSYYMPYEQALNAALVDGRSDIFALGATLYHLLTGRVPFAGASHEEIVRGKEHDAFEPVRAANPDIPGPLAEVVGRMLARDPRARFQQAGEVVAALQATGLATPLPAFPAVADPTAPEAAIDAPTRADLPARRPVPPGGPPPAGYAPDPTPLCGAGPVWSWPPSCGASAACSCGCSASRSASASTRRRCRRSKSPSTAACSAGCSCSPWSAAGTWSSDRSWPGWR